MADLRLTVSGERREVELGATWTDDAPETRDALSDSLPVEGDAVRWGDELYFDVPLGVGSENARAEVSVGAIAYWPAGSKLCLFWGPTPASEGDEPRAAAPVNVVARVDDVSGLRRIDGGAHVSVRSD